MKLSGWTHPGLVRDENQDALAWTGAVMFDAPPTANNTPGFDAPVLAAAVDGLGGHRGGRVAAHHVAQALAAADPSSADLVGTMLRLHTELTERGRRDPALDSMGAVAVVARVATDEVEVVHVGDARCYLHAEDYTSLTTDDDRVGESNVLLQCLGGTSDDSTISPTVTRVKWSLGDRLLLCSDGLSDLVPFKEIQDVLRTTPLERCAQRLVAAALGAGAPDNVTVVVIENSGEES